MVILSILENIMYYAMLFKDTVPAATQKAPGPNSRAFFIKYNNFNMLIPATRTRKGGIGLATFPLG